MTVSSPVCSDVYVATGSTAVFPYTWQLLQAADLLVLQTALDGTITTLVLTTDYTISDVGSPLGGDVTLVAGNPTAGVTIGLYRAPAILQQLLLQQGAAFNPADLMRSLDLLTMIAQWLQNQLDRALVVPPGSTPITLPDPEALALLQWNVAETGLQNLDISDLANILAAGNYVIDTPTFTPGVTTALTLSVAPGTVNNTWVYFDGVYQQKATYSVAGLTLTLTSPVPLGTQVVEVGQAGILPINTPADNSVATATVQNLAITGPKIAVGAIDATKMAVGAALENLLPLTLTLDLLAAGVLQAGKNGLINGSAIVAQRTDYAAPGSGTYGYGKADRCKGALTGGTSVAGTLTQTLVSSAGITGCAFRWSAVTLVGTSCTIKYRFFIEAKDALRYKNGTASFSAKVYHDVGASVNYTITVSKANAADNFAAITTIQAGSAQAVATATATAIYLRAISMGDCSNGIQIDIVAATGAIAAKLADLTDVQLELGSTETAIEIRPVAAELAMCQRYYWQYVLLTGSIIAYASSTQLVNTGWLSFPMSMRVNPTTVTVSAAASWEVAPGAIAINGSSVGYSSAGFALQLSTAAPVFTADALYRMGISGVGTPSIAFDADF